MSKKSAEEKPFQKKVIEKNLKELDYKEIIKNRDNFCGIKPSEKLSLFKKISWIYCYHGLKRIFGKSN